MIFSRSRARLSPARSSAYFNDGQLAWLKAHPYTLAAGATVGAMAISALVNRHLAKKAERANPPSGRFLQIDGVRLHYADRGEGEPLVLLHGNGSMIQDFQSSGLVEMAAQTYRVIVFDRPGYGHSNRPRSTIWTPEVQADLIRGALRRLDVSRATVLGHSWGASVALALALKHPEMVGGLILASGYYYPTTRPDFLALSGLAVPVIGDVVRHTLSPILGRLMWPLIMRKIFGPAPVPAKFNGFPKEMALRPLQIRASATESALLIANAFAAQGNYANLSMPVVIVAGENDRLVDINAQSARLHREVPHSALHRVPGTGHMVHQTATDRVMDAIDEAAGRPVRWPVEIGPRAA